MSILDIKDVEAYDQDVVKCLGLYEFPGQGGELARCEEFRSAMETEFGYIVEPTGADSPSQNGLSRYTMASWAFEYAHYCTVPASQPSFGHQHCYTRHTYTIVTCILRQK